MSADSTNRTPGTDTRRWDTRQLATMAILVTVGTLISFIEIPLIPGFEFLRYDPSSVAMLIAGFIYGPFAGAVVGTLIALLHGSPDGILGIAMNTVAMLAMGIPAALIYSRRKTRTNALLALAVGSVVMVAVNLLANLIVTPIYLGVPRSVVIGLILPALLPFNAAKAIFNSILTLLVYKSVSRVARSGVGLPSWDSHAQDAE